MIMAVVVVVAIIKYQKRKNKLNIQSINFFLKKRKKLTILKKQKK